MEIKTKYNIGDNLYYISNKSVVKRGTVRGIRYTVATEFIPKKGYCSPYTVEELYEINFDEVSVCGLFRSKEELIKRLIDETDNDK